VARKKRKLLPYFVFVTAVAGACFVFFIGYLWWRSREVEFVKYAEFGIPIPQDYQIHGIDVSRYQQLISWDAVHDMQVQNIRLGFAFIKATEGNGNVDSYFKQNWRRARKAGMVRGAYHYFIATKDGKTQAQNFIDQVELVSGDLPPVLDIEQTFGASPAQMRKEMKKWLDTVQEYYAVRPIIYTYLDFYKDNLQGYFEDYPLWVAHYQQPHQPRISRTWTFWQHNESGRVNGILSKVDFDVFNGDSVAFRSLLVP
jgi:lysozyme